MTKITLRTTNHPNDWKSIKVNGRYVCLARRITELRQVSRGRWTGTCQGMPFEIEGGKAAGGTRRDWFVTGYGWDRAIDVNSAVEAIKLLESC